MPQRWLLTNVQILATYICIIDLCVCVLCVYLYRYVWVEMCIYVCVCMWLQLAIHIACQFVKAFKCLSLHTHAHIFWHIYAYIYTLSYFVGLLCATSGRIVHTHSCMCVCQRFARCTITFQILLCCLIQLFCIVLLLVLILLHPSCIRIFSHWAFSNYRWNVVPLGATWALYMTIRTNLLERMWAYKLRP